MYNGKFIRLLNRIESKKIDSVARIESKLFCPNWNDLVNRLSKWSKSPVTKGPYYYDVTTSNICSILNSCRHTSII